ncbi:HIT family protein [Halothermothrix orenii]|uniref:Histidine triad (HIT) protein n=1 Tax=Halothermothrix orenii (strain H 168 / OCM 544 / DSM 9562) TaxID=373903 RepID=B8D1Y7_HALOH|nr:HIT family protein [Halothermothrix orenii]ACL69214.1 histidine triad (HIT) protein [Halothermothrix orenii H 168]
MNCPFCAISHKDYIAENEYAFAIYDKYPVNKGHALIIPKRHVASYFDITERERQAIFKLVDRCKTLLDEKFNPDGYNIGINVGKYAGQTVMHLHVHLIPRYKGDIDDPTGGVRGVIPEKRVY